MSDKKYPYIGKSVLTMLVYIAYGNESFYCIDRAKFSDDIYEDNLKNITLEYLAKTYGKCESQEHADFICKLAENAGFRFLNDYSEKTQWFCFNNNLVEFYKGEGAAHHGEKLIHLPLPPKENQMEETKPEKPIYTKEMHERGELPPVGSFVEKSKAGKEFKAISHKDYSRTDAWPKGSKLEVIAHTEICGKLLPVVKCDNWVSTIMLNLIKPIPTIEDELVDYIKPLRAHSTNEIARRILEKYNITPKGE